MLLEINYFGCGNFIMLEFFRDQIWNFVAVFIALVVFCADLILYRARQKRKNLSYEIISNYPLISVRDGFDKVSILYENETVRNINMVVVRVFNSGDIPIRPDDFYRDVTFHFGSKSQILSSEIIDQNPRGLGAELEEINFSSDSAVAEQQNHPANKVVLSPILLNKGSEVKVKFLVSQFHEVNVDGLVVGVQEIEAITQPKPQSILFKGGSVAVAAIFILAFMSPILVGFGFTGVASTLLIGFLTGFIFSGIFGFFLTQIRYARILAGNSNRHNKS